MANERFNHYAGSCFLLGRNVAVYGHGETRTLKAETTGQHKIVGSKTLVVSAVEYRALREKWTDGGTLFENDAVITERALRYLNASNTTIEG